MFAKRTWLSFLPLEHVRMQKGFTFLGHILKAEL